MTYGTIALLVFFIGGLWAIVYVACSPGRRFIKAFVSGLVVIGTTVVLLAIGLHDLNVVMELAPGHLITDQGHPWPVTPGTHAIATRRDRTIGRQGSQSDVLQVRLIAGRTILAWAVNGVPAGVFVLPATYRGFVRRDLAGFERPGANRIRLVLLAGSVSKLWVRIQARRPAPKGAVITSGFVGSSVMHRAGSRDWIIKFNCPPTTRWQFADLPKLPQTDQQKASELQHQTAQLFEVIGSGVPGLALAPWAASAATPSKLATFRKLVKITTVCPMEAIHVEFFSRGALVCGGRLKYAHLAKGIWLGGNDAGFFYWDWISLGLRHRHWRILQ